MRRAVLSACGAILATCLALGPAAAEEAEVAEEPGSEVRPESGGALLLIGELRAEMARLARREQELDARERAIADLESEVLRMLDEVGRIRLGVEQRIADWEERNGDPLVRLAKVYAEMPPARAAGLLESLELDLATDLLRRMKHKESADVLSLMSSDSALRMSRRVAQPLALGDRGAADVAAGATP